MVTEEVPQTLLPLPLELLHPDLHDGGKYRVQEGLRKISMPVCVYFSFHCIPMRSIKRNSCSDDFFGFLTL